MNTKNIDLEIFNCNKCPEAAKYRAYPMPGFYGNKCYNNLAIVAQNPGLPNEKQKSKIYKFEEIYDDYIDGLKISPIGEFLLKILPIDFKYIFYSNVVKCAFPSQYPIDFETEFCKPYLMRQLEITKPRIIICLGAIALRAFRPGSSLTKCSLAYLRDSEYTIFPIFHPSYLNKLSTEEALKYINQAKEKLARLVGEITLAE